MAQISCEHVWMRYSDRDVLRDVSFGVEQGDYLCIVGENGSGKSTLLKGLLGLVSPSRGSIRYGDGLERHAIGYLPQQTQVQRDFPASVREVVLSGCLGKRGSRPFYTKEEKLLAQKQMERLGLTELQKNSYRDLSGGQQQRVLLARALCATDKLLLLDEPMTGLDPVVTADLYSLLCDLNATGVTVIMVSHDIETTLHHAKTVLHMDAGVLFFGAVGEYWHSEAAKRLLSKCAHDHE